MASTSHPIAPRAIGANESQYARARQIRLQRENDEREREERSSACAVSDGTLHVCDVHPLPSGVEISFLGGVRAFVAERPSSRASSKGLPVRQLVRAYVSLEIRSPIHFRQREASRTSRSHRSGWEWGARASDLRSLESGVDGVTARSDSRGRAPPHADARSTRHAKVSIRISYLRYPEQLDEPSGRKHLGDAIAQGIEGPRRFAVSRGC